MVRNPNAPPDANRYCEDLFLFIFFNFFFEKFINLYKDFLYIFLRNENARNHSTMDYVSRLEGQHCQRHVRKFER